MSSESQPKNKYTREELIKLAKVKINDKYCGNKIFYTMILNYFEGSDSNE